ncbi:hypothetical protein OKW30_007025 [Paraburkholderia sp. Clong3]
MSSAFTCWPSGASVISETAPTFTPRSVTIVSSGFMPYALSKVTVTVSP